MTREEMMRMSALLTAGALAPRNLLAFISPPELKASDFGRDFVWGTATAAYQIEGAWNTDGKGESIWDHFTHFRKGKIKGRTNGDVACDFYHRYPQDIALMKKLNFGASRFSLAWTRIIPEGSGAINQKGIDFYHRVLDSCQENGLDPWVTCYHWDLPQKLQERGGWENRDILKWFEDYVGVCAKHFGDRVKNWMVFNEPMAFVPLGYLIGMHAPGKLGVGPFTRAVHHAAMCHGIGGRVLRAGVKNGHIGTTLSCGPVDAWKDKEIHAGAVRRLDVMFNRLFIEPILGMGYPVSDLPGLKGIQKYILEDDAQKLKFDFDFIGLQYYTRTVAKRLALIPLVQAVNVPARKMGHDITEMGWEVYPEGIYRMLKKFSAYPNIPKLYVTENGVAFPDKLEGEEIHDSKRIQFFKDYLTQVLKAKNEGVDVRGYFVWTFMDNFEWAEGYHPRFGLVHVDFETQQRRVKDSGKWFASFLKS